MKIPVSLFLEFKDFQPFLDNICRHPLMRVHAVIPLMAILPSLEAV